MQSFVYQLPPVLKQSGGAQSKPAFFMQMMDARSSEIAA
jgi:hypothetical protein